MLKIIDTSKEMMEVFTGSHFDLEKWKVYIDGYVKGAKDLCLQDLEECLRCGYTWEKDFLPVLNGVYANEEKRGELLRSFYQVTEGLEEKIIARFGKTVDVDIVLYLGLCDGAGWVTPVNDRMTILLGVEKILELDWCSIRKLNGLILHELGHVYQAQYGVLTRKLEALPEQFLWQLFTEGIAMCFEQELVGATEYFHQDDGQWKAWCDEHLEQIKEDFAKDIHSMTKENQRYFGDWVQYEGKSDVGYYLGAKFVRKLMETVPFDELVQWDIAKVESAYRTFRSQRAVAE